MTRTRFVLASAAAIIASALALLPAAPASAHPLGSFSINEYVGLALHRDRVDAHVVIDIAEIPTLQDRPLVDRDGDATVSVAEAAAYAMGTCDAVATAIVAAVGGEPLQWTAGHPAFEYAAGSGGLVVSRLTCDLTAATTVDGRTTFTVDNRYLADRVGWREIVATGDGIRLIDSPVPATSISNELRGYPKDLLSSALTIRTATIVIEPGHGGPAAATPGLASGGDPVSRAIATLDRRFADLAGGIHLTLWVGLLAVLLAVVLGAGHAALPGHGKTVLAAYLAGRRGRPRDALVVAGTVTLTHTGGVLALGLLLTAGTALAGERILGWLGLASGVIVLGVGVGMVAGIWRRRATGRPSGVHKGHSHDHGPDADDAHDAEHTHGHGPHDHGDHGSGRRGLGLAGIGLAGGLVPSPSALVVLLGAIGLGRTGFGVLLVLAYGLGMAGTLTGAGLLLVVLQHRLARAAAGGRLGVRVNRVVARISMATPVVTAALVVVVGAGLAVRAAAGVL